MTKYLDYKKHYHEALLSNLEEVRKDVLTSDKDMEIKIF